ncbi:MAG: DUF2116 family Zn-ribbon domain-containing protein [Nitrosarchaeum sp.]|nr:DUF2116 family Zn-ribbon domain-containing protein [Nitrosarchaeum sp.]
MSHTCIGCGIELEGNEKFCSSQCQDHHLKRLKEIMVNSVRNDSNHTNSLAQYTV